MGQGRTLGDDPDAAEREPFEKMGVVVTFGMTLGAMVVAGLSLALMSLPQLFRSAGGAVAPGVIWRLLFGVLVTIVGLVILVCLARYLRRADARIRTRGHDAAY